MGTSIAGSQAGVFHFRSVDTRGRGGATATGTGTGRGSTRGKGGGKGIGGGVTCSGTERRCFFGRAAWGMGWGIGRGGGGANRFGSTGIGAGMATGSGAGVAPNRRVSTFNLRKVDSICSWQVKTIS